MNDWDPQLEPAESLVKLRIRSSQLENLDLRISEERGGVRRKLRTEKHPEYRDSELIFIVYVDDCERIFNGTTREKAENV